MGFRSVVISSRCKLEYSLNYLVCTKGLEQTKILLDEVNLILINTMQAVITSTLICECINKKIKILFTDEKHNISGELTPFKNNYYSARKLRQQIDFSEERKGYLWKEILKEKIINQSRVLDLLKLRCEAEMLLEYSKRVEIHDKSNKEGVSAKIYFRGLFGNSFYRDDDNEINACLNYGYAIILSCLNRAIKSFGYYTELGIHHVGDSNSFNLSCDFMEPLRPLIDSYVCQGIVTLDNFKEKYINVLQLKVFYAGREMFLDNAIEVYVENLLNYMNTGDVEKIKFIKYEL